MHEPRRAWSGCTALALVLLMSGCGGVTGTQEPRAGGSGLPSPQSPQAPAGGAAGTTPLPSASSTAQGLPPGAGAAAGTPLSSAWPTRAGQAAATRSPEPELDEEVIVDLAVQWRPEHELSQDEVRAQRERVARAEREVLEALGRHGRLRRQLHETAQSALVVDAEGLALLRRHPRVAKVQPDRAEPGGSS